MLKLDLVQTKLVTYIRKTPTFTAVFRSGKPSRNTASNSAQ